MQNSAENIEAHSCCDAAANVKQLGSNLNGLTDRYARALAEMDNMQKRLKRERIAATLFALEGLFKELLPFLDGLERADLDREGLSLLKRQVKSIAGRFGLEEIDAIGQRFDPERHEAIKLIATDEAQADTVCAEYARGYRLNGRLLRPSVVAVAKARDEAKGP